jgi:hypothetical protein
VLGVERREIREKRKYRSKRDKGEKEGSEEYL